MVTVEDVKAEIVRQLKDFDYYTDLSLRQEGAKQSLERILIWIKERD